MSLKEKVDRFTRHPHPLWETELTAMLVSDKWSTLAIDRSINPDNYSTAFSLHRGNSPIAAVPTRVILSTDESNGTVYLESPSFELLQTFYEEHGLVPSSDLEINANSAWTKVKTALNLLDQVSLANDCVKKLVRSIQVLNQEDPEIDVSYSHPDIPFSIFVSVCPDNSMLSTFRVAESILHEAMHLKLTLIEGVTPMIIPAAKGLYFSPWRDELRPAQGVLHGLFVFRAILDFYTALVPRVTAAREIVYLQDRITQITEELNSLRSFPDCKDLTKDAAILTKNLLPSS